MYRLQSLLFHPSRSCQKEKIGSLSQQVRQQANKLANTKIVLANLLANKLAKWNLAFTSLVCSACGCRLLINVDKQYQCFIGLIALQWLGHCTCHCKVMGSNPIQLVTAWMGDCLWTGKPSWYITNTKVNSAFHPSGVGKSCTGAIFLKLLWKLLRKNLGKYIGKH